MTRQVLVLLLVSCGGSAKQRSSGPVENGEHGDTAQGNCERGRCMDDISRVIQDHRTQTRACYDKGVKGKPGVEGRLIVNFKIDAAGAVEDASQGMQDNQITDPAIVDCVIDVVKHLEFAKSDSGKTTRAYHLFEFNKR